MDPRDLLKGPGQLAEKQTKYPVTHFKATALDFIPELRKGNNGDYTAVVHKFSGLQIIEQVIDYPGSTYEIDISYSETDGVVRADTKWGKWVKSIQVASASDEAMPYVDQFNKYLKGTEIEAKLVSRPGNVFKDGAWEAGMVMAWEVLAIDGISGQASDVSVSARDRALGYLAAASTSTEFMKSVASDVALFSDEVLFEEINSGEFVKVNRPDLG